MSRTAIRASGRAAGAITSSSPELDPAVLVKDARRDHAMVSGHVEPLAVDRQAHAVDCLGSTVHGLTPVATIWAAYHARARNRGGVTDIWTYKDG